MDIQHQTKVLEQLMNVYGRTLDQEIIRSVAFSCRFHFGKSATMLDEITANVTPRNNSFTVPHHLTNGITRHTPNARTSQLTQTTEQIKRGYKVLVILRGLPGSGKSYLARKIVEITVGCQDHHNFIYSADDYFMRRGLYQFDGSKIQDAHAFNQQRAFEAMRRGVSPVIIDNTNTQMWEMKPYAMAASQYAYIIEILEPDTPWAFNDRELFRKNIHGVPRVKLKEMLGRYEKNITSRKLINAYGIRYGNMLPPQLRTYPPLVESAKECVERPENATPSIDDMLMHCEDKVKPTKAKAAIPETDLSTWGVSETALHSWDICTPVVTKQETDSAESVTCGFMMVSRVETSDAATNTCSSDFVLVANPDGVAKVLVANNRDINEQCSFRIPPPRQKILVDKGSMVGEDLVEQCLDKKEALERLSAVFPSIPHIYLREIHDRCQGDLNWAIDVLCDDNLHNLMTPQEEEPEQEEQPEQEEEKQNPNLQEQNITTPPPSPQEEHNTTAVADAVEREQLKRLLEEKVVIRDDFYSEHTLKLKSRNNFDQNAQPSTSKVQTDTVVDSDVDMDDFDLETASESTTSASDTQDMIELNLGDAFVTELESKLQEPTLQYPKGFLPIVQVPVALARQLYALYIESVYQQMDAQNEVLDMLIKEDEEFARKIQAQEQQQQQQQEPTTLPEIMQEQYELSLCKRETEQWKNLTPDDFAAKMTKKKLFESFPNIGKDVLVEIWQAHGNNYKETVESILASSPEQAALSQGEIENPPVPEEIVEEMREVHNQQNVTSEDVETKTAQCYRQDAARHLDNRILLYQKAMQAYQKGMTEVAIYYSDLAKKQTELYDQANNLAASMFLNEHSQRHQNYDTLDLHFLYVKEAIAALDIFLDNSVHLLKGTNRTQYLFIITGRGKRSANGISKIKPAVKGRLKKRKVNFVEINPGLLKVKVSEHSIVTTDLPEVRATQNT